MKQAQAQLVLSMNELLMVRHAMQIACEDGKLFMEDEVSGKVDRGDFDQAHHINHKLEVALERIVGNLKVVR